MKTWDYTIMGVALICIGLTGLVESHILKDIFEKVVVLCGGLLIGRSL